MTTQFVVDICQFVALIIHGLVIVSMARKWDRQ